MTRKLRKLSGNYSYECLSCNLLFLPEETPSRYNREKRTCIRCLVEDKHSRGELELPSCYGKRYDGLEEACIRYCSLREACIVQSIDESSIKWAIDRQYMSPKYQNNRGRRFSFIHHVVRILRAAGRPMYSDDIAPLIAYNNGGIEKYIQNRHVWNTRTVTSCDAAEEVVALGDKFYVWIGVWDLRQGGIIRKETRKPSDKLISIEEIFKDM